jgi:Tat protein secretion system quality control protein TatD with DNase activity
VAEEIGRIRGMDINALEQATTENFFRLFKNAAVLAGVA